MTRTSLILHTQKADDNTLINMPKLNFTPEERGKALDVAILGDDDKSPYDLSDLSIRFIDRKDGDKVVVDDGEGEKSGKFIRTSENDKLGKFQYIIQANALEASGVAQFTFYKDDERVDSTNRFRLEIDRSMRIDIDNTSYISDLSKLQTVYENAISEAENQIDSLKDAIKSGKEDISNEVIDAQKQVDELVSQTQKRIDGFTGEFKKIDDIDAQLQKIKDSANQLAEEQKDEAALKVRVNNISDNLNSLTDQVNDLIKSKPDLSIYDTIEDVDQKLLTKVNKDSVYSKSEIDSQVSDIKSSIPKLPDLTPYETVKDNDAKLSKKADTDVVNSQIEGVKKDIADSKPDLTPYETIKDSDSKLADKADKSDVDAQVEKLKKDITNNKPDLAPYETIKDNDTKLAKKADAEVISGQISGLKDDIANQRKQIDEKLGTKITFQKCDSPQAAYEASAKPAKDGSIIIGYYDPDSGPTSAVIGDKTITISSLYDSLTALQAQISGLSNLQSLIAGKADTATVYTKSDIDKLLSNKIDRNDVYTKSEVDKKISSISKSSESGAATPTDVYTKTDIDSKLSKKADKSELANYAKSEDVNTELAKKVNSADLTPYAKSEDISAELDKKANSTDLYTKDEIDGAITNATKDLGKVKTVSINGSDPVSPDEKGNADLTVTPPDLSAYSKKEDTYTKDEITQAISDATSPITKELDDKAISSDLDKKASSEDITTLQNQLKAALLEIDELKKKKLFTHFSNLADAQKFMQEQPEADTIVVVDDPKS